MLGPIIELLCAFGVTMATQRITRVPTAQSLPARFKAFLTCLASAEFLTFSALHFEQMCTTRHYNFYFDFT
jgi:hypothetical protein